ncbi:MAG TPA: SsrA-binding protein SmpB [Candidatus Saccharimonadales bacterium]
MRAYNPITINRRAKYDYAITDRIIAGISLQGPEVKSVRLGRADLKGGFATLSGGELWLNNLHIPLYQPAGEQLGSQPDRRRKLLIHKRQLKKVEALKQSGLNLIPLSIGKQGRFIKLELGIGRGKKRYDKRHSIKQRMADREALQKIKHKAK